MRYRLIQGGTTWRMGADHPGNPVTESFVREEAADMVANDPEHRSVLIVEHPEGGIVRQVGIVGQDAKKVRRR